MRLRVLLLAPHPFYSHRGTPMAEKALVEALCGEGHRVDILTYHEGSGPEIPGSRIFRIPPPPGVRDVPPGLSWKKVVCDLFFAVSFFRRIRAADYDLVHAVEESVFLARLQAARGGPPYVYDMDSSLAEEVLRTLPFLRPLRPAVDAVERWAIQGSAGVLAMCPSLAEDARDRGAAGPVGVAEDATLLRQDPDRIDVPAELDDLGSGLVVMYVGNLAPYQGVDLLVDAFGRLSSRHPEARLVIVGGSEDRIDALRRQARRQGSGSRSHFLGPRPPDRLGTYLAGADVVVSPRLHGQNTPMKIYSYLDSGRPLVATDIPAHTQVLDDDVAVLVDPAPVPMAEGLDRLLSDQELRHSLATHARRRARERYTPEARREKIISFYERLLASLPERLGRGTTRAS